MTKIRLDRRKFIRATSIASATALVGPRVFAQSERYQYIVIGSGAGGGPVCANLAKAGKRVLLIEAGDAAENLKYKVPAFWSASTEDSTFSWNYYVKQNSDYDLLNSKFVPGKGILYPRAGTLGGCTAHNAMITMYPDHSDWDNLANITGDRSWHSNAMRRYYQRVERALYLKPADAERERRGTAGWLGVERTDPRFVGNDPALLALLLAAATESGFDQQLIDRAARGDQKAIAKLMERDPNDWDFVTRGETGLIGTPKATRYGRRNGTRELLLEAKRRYRNFSIQTNALATRLLFADDGKKVIGVEYLEGASLYEADPRSDEPWRDYMVRTGRRRTALLQEGGEIIVSGGAFNTPQLLMLSGIGPREELKKHGIKERVRLEGVGQNLQDRYEVGVITKLKNPTNVFKDCTFASGDDACLTSYNDDPQKSIYGSNGVLLGYKMRSKQSARNADLFLFGLPVYFHGYYPGWSSDALKPDHFSWVILKGHTNNTAGTVKLKSKDPTAAPDINFRYFSDGNDHRGDDLAAVVEGVRKARKINQFKPFQSHVDYEAYPSNAVLHDDDVREFVQKEAFGHHASCSNKMGPAQDHMAVVDTNFKVHGVDNLRIVDASVFPKIPGLFIAVPIYMIAEKASDVILREAKT